MKTNVQTVKYNQNSTVPNKCVWWSWEEICDDCGKVIYHLRELITTEKPKIEENDFCIDCLYKKINRMILSKGV